MTLTTTYCLPSSAPGLQKVIRFQKSTPRWDLEKLYDQRHRILWKRNSVQLNVKVGMLQCSGTI